MVADSVLLQSRTFEADCRAAQSGMQAHPKSGIVESFTWLFLSCRGRTTIAVGPCLGYPDSQVWTWSNAHIVQATTQQEGQDSKSARRGKNAERAHPRVIVLFQQLRWQWDQRATMPSTIEQLILH